MTIGVDLRVFQIGHQYRGIGAHITNLIREISKLDNQPKLVFYEYPNLDSGLNLIQGYVNNLHSYEIRKTEPRPENLSFLRRELVSFKERYIQADAGLGDFSGIDVMLCVDFNLGVPKRKFTKTALISYDMIPWVLSDHYLPNFIKILKITHSLKRAIKAQVEKRLYFNKIKQANKRAEMILSISEYTKKDLVKYLGVSPKKIHTVLLGVDNETHSGRKDIIKCNDINGRSTYVDTSKEKYIFFMGGTDRRRRIEDLVSAYDLAEKKLSGLKLILAGYDFQNIDLVPDSIARNSILNSTNRNKIYFGGFVSSEEKNSLYENAIAYIFPSIYEGFGLPILESMSKHCPVITYDNTSIREVGGQAALYASNIEEIAEKIQILAFEKKTRINTINRGIKQAKNFSWSKTTENTLKHLDKLVKA